MKLKFTAVFEQVPEGYIGFDRRQHAHTEAHAPGPVGVEDRPHHASVGAAQSLLVEILGLTPGLRPQVGGDLHDSPLFCRRFFSMITLLMNAVDGLADSTSARHKSSTS